MSEHTTRVLGGRPEDLKPPPVELIEDPVARYAPGESVGEGGMGEVVLAEDRVLGRDVALKRLPADQLSSPRAVEQFLLEARMTGRLVHPNIMDVYDLGIDEAGRPYYTMPYLRGGETLEAVIERLRSGDPRAHARFTMQRRAQIAQDLCQALRYAHEQRVVHLDIKPGNVMLGAFGEVVLLDWGLVRDTDEEEGDGEVHGTPGYMAPEQLRGEASVACDVYMLCATLYELFTLHHYLGLPGEVRMDELLVAVVEREPLPADAHVDRHNGRVPRDLARLCADGLRKDPAERTQSVAEVEAALQLYLERMSPVMCPTTLSIRMLSGWQQLLIRHPGPVTALTLLGLGLFPLSLLCLAAIVFRLV